MVTKKMAPSRKVAKKVAKRVTASPPISRTPVVEAESTTLAPGTENLVVLPHADKQKLIRDSFTMPRTEYELLAALKGRLLQLARPTKKSELLRAGVVALALMSDTDLLASVVRIPSLKTGRPKKAKESKKNG